MAKEQEQREVLAATVLSEMQTLTQHRGWQRIAHEINRQVEEQIKNLLASDKDDDRRRGQVAALRSIAAMPTKIIESASAELNQHRGM